MNNITLTTVDGLEPGDAVAIARRLTKQGSEFQIEVVQVLGGESSSSTPVALWSHDGAVVSWACSHIWKGKQTLEMFTDERHRGTGKASTLASMLAAAGVIDREQPVAVFSETTAVIATRLGLQPQRYERQGSEWVLV